MIDIEVDEAFLEKLKTGLKTKEEHFGKNIFFLWAQVLSIMK